MNTLDDKTKVTIGLMIPICALVFWLAQLQSAIGDIKSKEDQVQSMALDIAVVKSQVLEINKKLDN